MANTSTIYTAIDHSTDAGFRVWGTEFHAQLLAIGLTLTSDTGQINWTTVVRPALNGTAGYEIWRFNDTLQGTTPIFIKFEFGTSSTINYPSIWISIGNGSNGSGTLTGLTSNKTICGYPTTPLSTTTLYFSRFVYNPTLGFFGFSWKMGLQSLQVPYHCGFIFRSCDSAGAAMSTSAQLLTNSYYATAANDYGCMQCLNYTTGLVYPPILASQSYYWSIHPFQQTVTATGLGTNLSIDPIFYITPTLGITQCLGRALITEVGIHAIVTATLVGSTPHNYIQIGPPFANSVGNAYCGYDMTAAASAGQNMGLLMLWE